MFKEGNITCRGLIRLLVLAIESFIAASPAGTLDLDFALNHSLWAFRSIGLGHQRNRVGKVGLLDAYANGDAGLSYVTLCAEHSLTSHKL